MNLTLRSFTRPCSFALALAITAPLLAAFAGCASGTAAATPKAAVTTAAPSTPVTTPTPAPATPAPQTPGAPAMRLGNFSVSLAVKDIAASRAFYEKLGFKTIGGNQAQNWLILQNETATIGLFQGMFEKNMLTFNPGWDRTCATLKDYDDVRDLQRALVKQGLTLATKADEATTGPASFVLIDPDGNPILVDQHVPSPVRR